VLTEASFSGIKIDRRDIKTVGQLIARLPLCDMGGHYREMAAQLRELARRCRFRTGRGELVQLAATFEFYRTAPAFGQETPPFPAGQSPSIRLTKREPGAQIADNCEPAVG
jgi:hypothetical protein